MMIDRKLNTGTDTVSTSVNGFNICCIYKYYPVKRKQ
jgi:hypothetical protein